MKVPVVLLTVTTIATYILTFNANAESFGSLPLGETALNYIEEVPGDIVLRVLDPPRNKNSSIRYLLYTKGNSYQPCVLEPTQEALRNCPIDPRIPTILLIHGFTIDLNPGNAYEVLKNSLLEREPCNVIILDWTKYDGPPYVLAVKYTYLIGVDAASLIKFLVKYAGLSTDDVTVIGHSLGAHMAGAIGKNLPGLKRIDALDPAGPGYETPSFDRLYFTDANFVQVMHTSNVLYGSGLKEALGHMDFYVNGGERQPHCHYGKKYLRANGDIVNVNTTLLMRTCHHEMSILYYINTIKSTDCKFLATKCNNYRDFKTGKCRPKSSVVGQMGFYGQAISGLPPLSKFYLRTSEDLPYCLKDGFKPQGIFAI